MRLASYSVETRDLQSDPLLRYNINDSEQVRFDFDSLSNMLLSLYDINDIEYDAWTSKVSDLMDGNVDPDVDLKLCSDRAGHGCNPQHEGGSDSL